MSGGGMDQVLGRVPLDRITERARDVELGRTLLTLVAGLLYLLGWLAAKVVGVAWLAIAWSFTAVRLGWVEARNGRKPDDGGH